MIGFIAVNGFNQKQDSTAKMQYLDLTISGLNDVVQTIKDNEIAKIGAGLYKEIYKSILPKSKVLRKKTLLIVGKTYKYIDMNALAEANIKQEKVSVAEFEEMEEDELSEYCLMYFAYNAFTEISIYDLGNNDLIYTRHFANGKKKLTKADVSAMVKSCGLED